MIGYRYKIGDALTINEQHKKAGVDWYTDNVYYVVKYKKMKTIMYHHDNL